MKRVTALIMSVAMLFSIGAKAFASEREFNLIEYLENNKVESHLELVEVLANATGYPVESIQVCSLNDSCYEEVAFSYEIDYENNLVEVDTIYESSSRATSTKSGSAVHDTISASGALMYTVKIIGTFSYTTTSCTNTSRTGSYVKGPNSLWNSTPTTTHGSISASKAFARVSGVARWLLQSSSYQLTLMCDTSGKLSSSFTRP